MSSKEIPLKAVPARFAKWAELIGERMALELQKVVARALLPVIVKRSPVGHPSVDRKTKKRKKGTKHPGKFRASTTFSVGTPKFLLLPDLPSYPVPNIAQLESQLTAVRNPGPFFFANAAADEGRDGGYAASLEAGRRFLQKHGRWFGSEAAPEGIFGPAVEEVARDRGTLEAAATRRIEALL